ncbi:MAG: hypothetical protein AB1733_03970 [Thermodesulfobacteriota bacterium]
MAKRQIRIREALHDVRSGMSDAELMAKYQLAARGLQSLFAKLVDAGLITLQELERRMPGFMQSASLSGGGGASASDTWTIRRRRLNEKAGQPVSAKEAVADIRAGMSDSDLMHKFKLTSRGIQDLFDQLIAAKLITRKEIDQRNSSMDSTVDLKGFISGLQYHDLLRVMEDEDEDEAYESDLRDTSIEIPAAEIKDLQKAPPPGSSPPSHTSTGKASVSAPRFPPEPERVLADVRAGLTDGELMDKYAIDYQILDSIFNQLLEEGVATRGELYGRSSFYVETTATSLDEESSESEHYLAFPIPISDAMNPKTMGRLRTLGETELGTVGIQAKVNEYKTLVIFPEKFVDVQPITFDAMCVWSRAHQEGHYAKFRITYITQRDLKRLRDLLKIVTLG